MCRVAAKYVPLAGGSPQRSPNLLAGFEAHFATGKKGKGKEGREGKEKKERCGKDGKNTHEINL